MTPILKASLDLIRMAFAALVASIAVAATHTDRVRHT